MDFSGEWAGFAELVLRGAFLLILYAAADQDRKTGEIENGCWIGIAVLALYEGFLQTSGILSGPADWMGRGMGLLAASVPLFVCSLVCPGAFGGGDIKLQAAIGLFLGWPGAGTALAAALYAAGIYGAVGLLRRQTGCRRSFALGPFLGIGAALALVV